MKRQRASFSNDPADAFADLIIELEEKYEESVPPLIFQMLPEAFKWTTEVGPNETQRLGVINVATGAVAWLTPFF